MWLCISVFVCLVTSTMVLRVYPDANVTIRSNFEIEHSHNRWKRQTNGPCLLPPYPQHGSYNVTNSPDARPGQSMEYFVMVVFCRKRYGIMQSGNDRLKLHCSGGEWSHTMPKCVRFCKLHPDVSITYTCHIPGQGLKACEEFVPPRATVTTKCNAEYVTANDVEHMTCKNLGVWDRVARCKADCGRVTDQADLLLIGGTFAKFGEFPWHVGIYDKTTDPYDLICGGSIITNNVVISAAHCFWDDSTKLQPAENYGVATAKLYRDWDDEKDIAAQKSDVNRIKIPVLYQGSLTRFQHDIAILFLKSPFVYKAYLKPVCYDIFNAIFEEQQLRKDNLGKVAGWGLIAANGKPSPVLKVVNMPFVDEETCLKTVPASFKVYVSGDKFCAGYNGTGVSVCKGDSGGGLVFPDVEKTIERFYLRGLVSASPRSDDKECNDLIYSTFTKITAHGKFILDSITESTPKTCEWFLFQCDDGSCVEQSAECNGVNDCADGSDESYELCTPGATTTTTTQTPPPVCTLPPPPDHGSYEVSNNADAAPGQTFDSFVMTVTCEPGYSILSDDVIEDSNVLDVYCFNGETVPSMPACVHYCSLPSEPSVRYSCQKPDSAVFVSCTGKVVNGTTVKPVCSAPDYYSAEEVPNIKCFGTNLDFKPNCKPECGQLISKVEEVEPGDDPEAAGKPGHAPWYVTIYGIYDTPHCDGSIISKNAVITAAGAIRLSESGKFHIVTGRHFNRRDLQWGVTEPQKNTQLLEVKSIKYAGDKDNIAILVLDGDLNFTDFVRPVCLDFTDNYNDLEDETGKVSVSLNGFNPEFGSKIIVFEMKGAYQETCSRSYGRLSEQLKNMAQKDDLMCATYSDGKPFYTGVGGGLAFPKTEGGNIRYFLKAILSFTHLCQVYGRSTLTCTFDNENFVFFTKISKYEKFIKSFIYFFLFSYQVYYTSANQTRYFL